MREAAALPGWVAPYTTTTTPSRPAAQGCTYLWLPPKMSRQAELPGKKLVTAWRARVQGKLRGKAMDSHRAEASCARGLEHLTPQLRGLRAIGEKRQLGLRLRPVSLHPSMSIRKHNAQMGIFRRPETRPT